MIIGFDLGSVSLKYVVAEEDGRPVDFYYERTRGNIIAAIQAALAYLSTRKFSAVGVTGSGRKLLFALFPGARAVDEITAHRLGVKRIFPSTRTVVEIGGQDSKLIYWRSDGQVDFAMNTVCAAGTGSFLDQQAARLGLSLAEFCDRGLAATESYPIAAKCTVFAETDMMAAAQVGVDVGEIIAGLHDGLAANYWNNLCAGRALRAPVVFEGGAAENALLVRCLTKRLRTGGVLRQAEELLVPRPYHKVIGAWGAALWASKGKVIDCSLTLPDALNVVVSGRHVCTACERRCGAPVVDLSVNGRKVSVGKICEI